MSNQNDYHEKVMFEKLSEHIGHSLTVATYGSPPVQAAIECEDCHIVISSFDNPTQVEPEEPPDPEDFLPQPYTTYNIYGDDDEVIIHVATNDNFDRGTGTDHEQWHITYKGDHRKTAKEKALAHTGKSRQGIGQKVEVYLNGEQI